MQLRRAQHYALEAKQKRAFSTNLRCWPMLTPRRLLPVKRRSDRYAHCSGSRRKKKVSPAQTTQSSDWRHISTAVTLTAAGGLLNNSNQAWLASIPDWSPMRQRHSEGSSSLASAAKAQNTVWMTIRKSNTCVSTSKTLG